MANARDCLRQHLELAAAAYGADLPLPPGTASPKSAAAAAPPDTARPDTALPLAQEAQPAPLPPPPRVPAAVPAPAAAATAAAPAKPTGPAEPAGPAAAAAPNETTDRAPAAQAALAALRSEVLPCTRCKLSQGRTQVVFGEGHPAPRVLFVGEAPGAHEDRTGRPFVGQAGQLLDKILANAMGLRRDEVYIANVNKCRPPENRTPEADEVAACLPFLRRQVEILQPEVIVCLGRTAAQNLLGTTESTTTLRGRTMEYLGIPVVVTWHPAYLLREPSRKRDTWDDIKRVNRLLGRPEVPPPVV
jgi:DNA polymerase